MLRYIGFLLINRTLGHVVKLVYCFCRLIRWVCHERDIAYEIELSTVTHCSLIEELSTILIKTIVEDGGEINLTFKLEHDKAV